MFEANWYNGREYNSKVGSDKNLNLSLEIQKNNKKF